MTEKLIIKEDPKNILFITRAKNILSKKGAIIEDTFGVNLKGIFNPNLAANIEVFFDRNVGDWFDTLPQNLKPPIYLIQFWNKKEIFGVTSPYGKIDSQIIGPDEKLYFLDNIYLFGRNNTGTKFEKIVCDTDLGAKTLEESLEDWEIDPNKIKRANFMLNQNDSRYVNLQEEDYVLISDTLEQIETGKMELTNFSIKARLGLI